MKLVTLGRDFGTFAQLQTPNAGSEEAGTDVG